MDMNPFRSFVRSEGVRLYRDLPWRNTRDPYQIWVSEVMLQQTQVVRVETRWERWLDRFPSVFSLAAAPVSEVLAEWQGMGYNSRALALRNAAQMVAEEFDGDFPTDERELRKLPGIGPATAQGIRSFAFDLPGVYLETNVRAVFLHHFFPDAPAVPDKEIAALVREACPGIAAPQDADDTPRSWYYALLDYGAYLKKTVPNPSRRARAYTRQGKFEGSRRQKRAAIVRMLLSAHEAGEGALGTLDICRDLSAQEVDAGRDPLSSADARSILEDLARDGFCREAEEDVWRLA